MDADIFISLTHFKGHESTGFGGTLKNIGMGCGSRAGKMEMHNAGKPHVAQDTCVGCHACEKSVRTEPSPSRRKRPLSITIAVSAADAVSESVR